MSDDINDLSSETPPEVTSGAAPSSQSWFEQDDVLRTMWRDNVPPAVISEKLGRSVAAIMTRAVRLGLPRRAAPGRKVGYKRPDGAPPAQRRAPSRRMIAPREGEEVVSNGEPALRVCLMCLKKFPSEGRHNRICPLCKGSADYVKGSSLPETGFGEGV